MRCLADFILDSDLRFPDGEGACTLKGPDGSFELTLSNTENGRELSKNVLSAQLIFEAVSLDNAREESFGKVALALNCLSSVTNRKFALTVLKRIIDWTPGVTERNALIYVETPEWDTAEPALCNAFVGTAERLLSMQSGERQQIAMRWYRFGLHAETADEQFSCFWFALEIASQALKGNEKSPSKCPKCHHPLRCENCNELPTHRKYPGEAIRQMVECVHPESADEVFTTLQRIRHTLMHGGRIASVIHEFLCNEEQVVNKLAFVTWHAIGLMFNKPDPQESRPFDFGHVDNFLRRTLVASAHIKTTMKGDPNNPQLADFPSIQLTVDKTPIAPLSESATLNKC